MWTFYVGFSEPKKFKIGAFAIKLWTKSAYSHVYLRFESSSPDIPSTVYHAAHGMVHFRSLENFKKENNVVREYAITVKSEFKTQVLAHCMNLSGEPYGTLELFKIFATDVLDVLGIRLNTKNSRGYICSELVASILIKIIGDNIFEKPLHLIKPKDIEMAVIANRNPAAPAA